MMLWFVLFFAVAAFAATEWWSQAVLESLVFLLGMMCLRRDDFSPRLDPLQAAFGCLLALGVAQLLHPRVLGGPASLLPFTAAFPQSLYALLHWMMLAVFYWAAAGILNWDGTRRRLATAVFAIGLFIAIVGVVQRGFGTTSIYGLRYVNEAMPFGPFVNYNHAANWMIASFFLGFGPLMATARDPRRQPFADRLSKVLIIAFSIAVLGFAVLRSGSRGAVAGLCCATLIGGATLAFSVFTGRRRTRILAGVLLATSVYIAFLFLNPKWRGIAEGGFDASAGLRVSMYRSGFRMFQDFPIFGIGLGALQSGFRTYQERMVVGLVDHIHSSWLEILVEAGAVGFVLFMGGVFATLAAVPAILKRSTPESLTIRTVFFTAAVALLIHGLIEFSFQIPANAILLLAVLAANLPREARTRPMAKGFRVAMAVAFAVLAFVSLPPGLDGHGPRLHRPFQRDDDPIILSRASGPAGSGAAHVSPGARNGA